MRIGRRLETGRRSESYIYTSENQTVLELAFCADNVIYSIATKTVGLNVNTFMQILFSIQLDIFWDLVGYTVDSFYGFYICIYHIPCQ